MSGDAGNIFDAFSNYEDPKEIALVESIIEKTKSGRIAWERTSSSSLVANVPGMQINFVRSPSVLLGRLLGGSGWEMFTIRSQQGAELVKVQQPSIFMYGTSPKAPPPPRSKLLQAVDTLYSIADTKGEGDIDKAINVIKNL
jgi:hypothetical protein